MALTRRHSNSPPPVRYNNDSTNHGASNQKPTAKIGGRPSPTGGALSVLLGRETLATLTSRTAHRSDLLRHGPSHRFHAFMIRDTPLRYCLGKRDCDCRLHSLG